MQAEEQAGIADAAHRRGGRLSVRRPKDSSRPVHEPITPQEAARACAQLALEKKGEEVTILDLRDFEIGCDFFVLISGKTETHVRSLAEWIGDEMESRFGARAWHVEGRTHGRWILLDYVDWVAHIFHRETREYYRLENLWGDAPAERLADGSPDAPDTEE